MKENIQQLLQKKKNEKNFNKNKNVNIHNKLKKTKKRNKCNHYFLHLSPNMSVFQVCFKLTFYTNKSVFQANYRKRITQQSFNIYI